MPRLQPFVTKALLLAGAVALAAGPALTGPATAAAHPPPSVPAPDMPEELVVDAPTMPGVTTRCAWPLLATAENLNVAFPDTSSSYWVIPYRFTPGMKLTVKGTFAQARFFSLSTYDNQFSPVTGGPDSLYDAQIQPDNGEQNPYTVPGASYDATYTVTITADGTEGPNPLRAVPPDANGTGYLIFRVYIPTDPNEPAGTPALPAVSVTGAGGVPVTLPPCPNPGGNTVVNALLTAFVYAVAPGPYPDLWPEPLFAHQPPQYEAGFFPNASNEYVSSPVLYQARRIVVVRGRGPQFPDTRGGEPVTGPQDLRYWSMCNNIYAKPYPVVACAADYQTTLDSAGRYTYVVSTPADRPGNATTANGVTWLAWGTNLIGRPAPRDLLLMRNMVPAPGFTHAVQNVPPDGNPDTARDVMGAYYPEAVYCSTTLFEVGGADACFAQAEHPDKPHKPHKPGGPGHGKPGKPAEPGRSGKTGM
ncbi:hypothetical protein ACFYZ4_26025 [Streptomyces sp. NPDC001513]|uniref:hypothetical protein n=1 Tax=Streptomyces sp. NPDC001513 TaxID=3364580 RepID=UPI0036D0D48F